MEDRFGHVKFSIFYLICGLAATFAQLAFSTGSNVPNLGASGAIAGVLGAYILLFPQGRVKVLQGQQVIQVPAVDAFPLSPDCLTSSFCYKIMRGYPALWPHMTLVYLEDTLELDHPETDSCGFSVGCPPGASYKPGYIQIPDLFNRYPVLNDALPGHGFRIEMTPVTPGLRFWAFVSVTEPGTNDVATYTP